VPHDEGDISFYDALGVSPDASAQEIRDAFRLHVRLLHPDHQTDPQLKELADRQMQKLNRIYATLADPERRHAYDLAVHGVRPVPPITTPVLPLEFWRVADKMPWAAAIIVSTGVLIWLAYDNTPAQTRIFDPSSVQATAGSTQSGISPRQTDVADSGAKQIAQLKGELKSAFAERDQARHELAKLRGEREPSGTETPGADLARTFDFTPPPSAASADALAAKPVTPAPLTSTAKPAGSAPLVVGGAPAQRPAHTPNRHLAGFWFYAVPPEGQQNKNRSLYVPEYIEATISEDSGAVNGRYRSRFVISDRAIPPDVNFTFTGTLNGTQCSCEWTGGGGARCTVTLKLTGENSMKVDWAATELGGLGLASGTAILTRKIETQN
jgi:curved DNA-binding protein CbpA